MSKEEDTSQFEIPFSIFDILLWVVMLGGCVGVSSESPLSPEEALRSFRLDPAFEIDVFAAEPHVRDPVDLVFDERGRAFVAEMLDYPYGDTLPGSRIRLLRDRNGDGRIDDAIIFADSIQQISGLLPWGGGLIVTAAPDILFFRDTNGDDRADERRVLFTGFSLTNPQHRVSSPRFAVDNWIYVANDGQPGTIRLVERPGSGDRPGQARSVSVLGADFRFRLDRLEDTPFEAASGPAQFGQTFDDFGRRFITHNTIHVRHVVLPRRYFERNPYLVARATATDISDHGLRVFQESEPQVWRVSRTGVRSRRYVALDLDRTEHPDGFFTAASGGTIYGGDAFPEAYRGNLFTGEVAANVVHRDVLEPDGATFVARRAPGEKETEFLASTDPWFRPSLVTTGPDGYLYIVDMYREIIESPEYIPEPVRTQLDFYRGTEYGRIYRIRPKGTSLHPIPSFPNEMEDIVRALEHPNAWWRLTAQRLLSRQRSGSGVVSLVREVARSGVTLQGRLHALYVLESLGELDKDLIAKALDDPHPGVREHALRMAEAFPGLADRVVLMADDPDARVRLQAALSLGAYRTPEAIAALAGLAARHGQDPWFVTAILSAPPEVAPDLLERLLDPGDPEMTTGIVQELAAVVGARKSRREIIRLIELLESAPGREAVLSGLAAGLELAGARNLDIPEAARRLSRIIDDSEAARKIAAHFLMPDLAPDDPTDPPEVRPETLHLLASRQPWLGHILSGMEDGTISPHMLDVDTRLRLLENPDDAVRDRASALISGTVEVDVNNILNRTGDAARGRTLFYRECAVCHAPGARTLGPDLSGVSNKSREQLLEAIVDPGRAIPGTYAAYVVVLNDGSLVAGRIVAEMPGTLTFRGLRGDQTVLRSRIREIRPSARSLMPEDYGARLDPRELADLIAYLRAADVME